MSFTKYAGFGIIAGVAFFAVGLLVASAFTPVAPGTITNPTTFGPTEGNVVLSALGGAWAFTGNVTMPGNGIWNSSGNVGIGTTNPGQKLHVVGGIMSTDNAVNAIFRAHPTLTAVEVGTADSAPILFSSGGSEKMRITTGGNVGIGTINPAKTLDVFGETRFYFNGEAPALLIGKGTGVGGSSVLRILGDTSPEREVFRVERGGNVCINNVCKNAWPSGGSSTGDSSTLSKLQITSPASDIPSVANANLYLRGSDQGYGLAVGTRSTPYNQNGGVWLQGMVNDGTSTPSNILLNQLGGNVGIGTDKPADMLHIYEATDPNILVETTGGKKIMMGYNTAGNYGAFSTHNGTTWYGDTMVLKAGNVGIGTTSPGAKLEIGQGAVGGSGELRIDARLNNTGPGLKILASTRTYNESVVEVDDLEGKSNVVILASGNVGIGMANPQAKLHVSGGEIVDKNDRIVTGAGAMHLLAVGSHIYLNNNLTVQGNTDVYSNLGTPLRFNLPAKGRVLFTGSLHFSRQAGIAAVFLRAKFDGTVPGSADAYIPWGHNSGSFTIGLSPTDPPLSAGAHTLQVEVLVDNQDRNSKISINATGQGEGVKNTALYGYDYEP